MTADVEMKETRAPSNSVATGNSATLQRKDFTLNDIRRVK